MSESISIDNLAGMLLADGATVNTAVILGSGLSLRYGGGSREWPVSYRDIDGLTAPGVEGHSGTLFPIGTDLLIFSGRSHIYETGSSGPQESAVRLASALGCRRLLVTQAAGSLRPSLPPGSWMSASDVISFPFRAATSASGTGGGPLISEKMRSAVAAAAFAAGVPVRDGILFWTPGPNYETRAESMMMEAAGADAVTMSPIPELAAAKDLGMQASTLSWITNHTANVDPDGSGHESVVAMGRKGRGMLLTLLEKLLVRRPE